MGKTLGSGAFGTVRLAIHKATKQTRAVKVLKKDVVLPTDEEIVNRLKNDTNIWNEHVTIGGKDYPYLPPLQ